MPHKHSVDKWRYVYRLGAFALKIFMIGLAIFILLPIIVLALYSVSAEWNYPNILPQAYTLEWYEYLFKYEEGLSSLILSLEVAILSTLIAVSVSLPVGYILSRWRIKGRSILESLFLTRLVIPVIVIAVGCATIFMRIGLHDSFLGILLAHVANGLPFTIWTLEAAFESLDPDLEAAARTLGASPITTFFRITLPLAAPGIIAGSIFMFLYSLDEFTITFLISGVRYKTLPLRLYSVLEYGYIEPAAATSIILLIPSIIYLILVIRFMKPEVMQAGFGRI